MGGWKWGFGSMVGWAVRGSFIISSHPSAPTAPRSTHSLPPSRQKPQQLRLRQWRPRGRGEAGWRTCRDLAHDVHGQHVARAVRPGRVALTLPFLLAHIPERGEGPGGVRGWLAQTSARRWGLGQTLGPQGAAEHPGWEPWEARLRHPPPACRTEHTLGRCQCQASACACAFCPPPGIRLRMCRQPCLAPPSGSPLAAGVAVGATARILNEAPEQARPAQLGQAP